MSYWQRLRNAVGSEPLMIPSVAGALQLDGKVLLVRSKALQKLSLIHI